MYTVESLQERHDKRKRLILELIRNEPGISRTGVKQRSGLSMDSTLSLIAELIEEGLLQAGEKADTGRAGRKAIPLSIRPEGGCFIGVRFSAEQMTGVCLDFGHRLLCEQAVELPPAVNTEQMLAELRRLIQMLLSSRPNCGVPLRGIGIGAPGLVDPHQGMIRRYVHIAGCEQVPLRAELEGFFHVPVMVENGVRCSAEAFLRDNENAGIQNLVYLQTGRGINMCAYSGGHLLSGSGYLAGELGHLPVEGASGLCECGHYGCLETVAGSAALHRSFREQMESMPEDFPLLREALQAGAPFGTDTFLRCAEGGDCGCRRILRNAGLAVGLALCAAVTILNPEALVICGRLSTSQDYREGCEESLKTHALPESLLRMRLTFRDSDRRKDAIGAAGLPYLSLFGNAKAAE